MPEQRETVLAWDGGDVFLAEFDGTWWRGISEGAVQPPVFVTHWMPLPPLPGHSAPPKSSHGFTAVINAYTDNIHLREAIDAYLEMRVKNKMVITERAVKMLLKRLDTVATTTEDRIAVAENATLGAWKSFYELPRSQKKTDMSRRESSYDLDDLEAMLNQNIL